MHTETERVELAVKEGQISPNLVYDCDWLKLN